jgi:hypothetical protein
MVKKCFYIILLLPYYANAQDSVLITRNQMYAEVFGNNFADWNSYNWSYISLNYDRKMGSKSNFILSVGVSAFRSKYIDESTNPVTYPTTTAIAVPFGFLWRHHYKRNGFWVGLFATPTFGKQWYYVESFSTYTNYVDNFSSQFSPNVCYQFQSKSEKFFFRISFAPKLYASIFSEKFGNDHVGLPLWGGISIGGAW